MGERKAWLDIAVIQCPKCGRYYADASWYVVEMGADIECGNCRENFNTKRQLKDRVMLELKIDNNGKVVDTEVSEHVRGENS